MLHHTMSALLSERPYERPKVTPERPRRLAVQRTVEPASRLPPRSPSLTLSLATCYRTKWVWKIQQSLRHHRPRRPSATWNRKKQIKGKVWEGDRRPHPLGREDHRRRQLETLLNQG
jgi:hypothetical protein